MARHAETLSELALMEGIAHRTGLRGEALYAELEKALNAPTPPFKGYNVAEVVGWNNMTAVSLMDRLQEGKITPEYYHEMMKICRWK